MKKWQISALTILAFFLVLGILLGWGSVGSVLCAFLLMVMGAAVLIQKYLNNRDPDEWQADHWNDKEF